MITPIKSARRRRSTPIRSCTFDTHPTANPDVDAAHVNPLEHFLLFGAHEGRAAINGGWL
jgi:hypothetical protein